MQRPRPIARRSVLRAGVASLLSSSRIRTARADESGTLTVALSNNPVTCDPINMSSHDTQILSQTIYENLLEFDIEGNLKPQLAKARDVLDAARRALYRILADGETDSEARDETDSER